MNKFLVIGYGYDYYEKVFSQVKDMNNAIFCNNVRFNFIERILYHIHNSNKINQIINLPLKEFWSKYYTKKLKKYIKKLAISQDDNLYFIFLAGGLNNNLLKIGLCTYLRKQYKNCHIVFFCTDLIETTHKPIWEMKRKADLVISYDPKDAQKYGIEFHNVPYSNIKQNYKTTIITSDICFIGAAKNRLKDIYKIYDYLIQNRCKCEFYITGVRTEDQRIGNGLYFVDSLSYEQYLSVIMRSNCMLELIQQKSSGNTLRINEAIIFDKRIVSNNQYLVNNELYQEEYMFVFDDVTKIDKSFILNKTKVNYKNKRELYPDKLFAKIVKCIEQTN